MDNINLKKGQPYMVKYRGGMKSVRRIYRGEEEVLNIKHLVFSSKVKKGVYAVVDEVTNAKGEKTGVCFYHWKNTNKAPLQDIPIPYYDLLEVRQVS